MHDILTANILFLAYLQRIRNVRLSIQLRPLAKQKT